MLAQETGACPIVLLEISHASMTAPLRITSAGADVVSGGETYVFLPFEIELPADTDDTLPQVTLRIDNVGREMGETIRTLPGAPIVRIAIVLSEAPDVLEVPWMEFRLTSAEVDAATVAGTLSWESLLSEPACCDAYTPVSHPGLF